ncbi:MAG: hypothetical protein ACI3YI_05080 [Bacteroidaceae bacterium]
MPWARSRLQRRRSSRKQLQLIANQQIADDATEASEAVEESLPLDAIEAVYPKLGTYRNESLSIWESFSEEKKRKATGFVQTYISQTPNSIDQMYLNRYLGAEPWEK